MKCTGASITVISLLVGCGAGQQREISDTSSELAVSEAQLADNPYHSSKGWASVIDLRVSETADAEIVEATLLAVDTWNEAMGRELIQFGGRKSSSALSYLFEGLADLDTVIYAVGDWQTATGKSADVLGTTVWENSPYDERLIVRGDILLNVSGYDYRDASVDSGDYIEGKYIVDAETVIVHEIGHLLGLNHVAYEVDSDSVMLTHTTIGQGQYRRKLSGRDVSLIHSLYN